MRRSLLFLTLAVACGAEEPVPVGSDGLLIDPSTDPPDTAPVDTGPTDRVDTDGPTDSDTDPDHTDTDTDTDVHTGPRVELRCDDGVDDDGDGLIDCEDGDCAAVCLEAVCDDTLDDDGDGDVDCFDEDCWGTSSCGVQVRLASGRLSRVKSSFGYFRYTSSPPFPSGACPGAPPAPVPPGSSYLYGGLYASVATSFIAEDLVGEVDVGPYTCPLTIPRATWGKYCTDMPCSHWGPLVRSATAGAPCDSLFRRHGQGPQDVLHSVFIAKNPPMGPQALRAYRGRPTRGTSGYGTGHTSYGGYSSSSYGSYGAPAVSTSTAMRYPRVLSAPIVTSSTPRETYCHVLFSSSGMGASVSWFHSSAAGPLSPTTFPVDLP